MAITNRIAFFIFTVLFIGAVITASYFQQIYILAVPFGLLACTYLIQNPKYLFYLLLLSIPWSIEFNFTQSLGTDLPDEPFMLLTALATIIWIIYHHKQVRHQPLHPLLFILFLQFSWTIITVAGSTNFVFSFKYLLAKTWYLLAFVVTPYFLFKDEKIFKRSASLLLCSMLAFMLLALVRHAMNGFTFESINRSLQPFYINHVNYSALLVFMVPIQIALLKLSSSKKIKIVFAILLTLTIVALYFSYARGSWLALIAGLMTYGLIRKKLLLPAFVLFISFCIAGIIFLKSNDRYLKFTDDYQTTIFHTNFREHLIATYQLKDVSNAERIYRWVAGVRMVKDSWETGFGPNSFYNKYKSYTIPAFKTWVSNNAEHSTVHNYFLLMLIEQGAPGLFLFLALVGAMFWYVQKLYHQAKDKFWKIVSAAVGAILVMECVINFLSDMVETDKAGSIFYLCIATLIVADCKTRNTAYANQLN